PARFHQTGLAEAETRDRLHRDIAWRLALAGRAMAELWRRRGFPDAPFLLPIAVDLRPKGEPGAILGNQLAFHFARFRPSQTGDLPRLARDLREQMADAVRTGEIDANAVAMEFLRFRPVTRMLRALPWAAGGETFSFHCADLGGFPETLERVFGRRVLDAYHVPAVMPSPGIGIFFNRCGDRENLVVSWIDGAVSDEEAARVVEAVVEGMTWVHSP